LRLLLLPDEKGNRGAVIIAYSLDPPATDICVSFPPSKDDLDLLRDLAARVASPFRSRLIVTDFVRDKKVAWHFLEAGPGAVAGTAHEGVFKHVAAKLIGQNDGFEGDDVGGPL